MKETELLDKSRKKDSVDKSQKRTDSAIKIDSRIDKGHLQMIRDEMAQDKLGYDETHDIKGAIDTKQIDMQRVYTDKLSKEEQQNQVQMLSQDALDQERHTSEVQLESRRKRTPTVRQRWNMHQFGTFMMIGFTMGCAAYCIDTSANLLQDWKFSVVEPFLKSNPASAWIVFVLLNIMFTFTASLMVEFVEPVATGSGIPEVKAQLNGCNQTRQLEVKTCVIKTLGIILSVSGGLVIGKEGPMIHIGSCIGAFWAVLPIENCLPKSWDNFCKRFRRDRHKHDFVAAGAGAGVCGAFMSPIGGVCFAVEEATTQWNQQNTFITFFTTMCCGTTLQLLNAAYQGTNNFYFLTKFGNFASPHPLFFLWEQLFIGIIPLFAGLMGGAFCNVNKYITKQFRRKQVNGRHGRRLLEVMLITALTATFWQALPQGWSCQKLNEAKQHHTWDDIRLKKVIDYRSHVQFRCGEDEQNPMASISFTNNISAVKGLFHNHFDQDISALFVYVVVGWVLAVITYGIAVPSGLFVPCLLIGGALGRMIGHMCKLLMPNFPFEPGAFAVFGAGAMLSSVTRLTITIVVILFEVCDRSSLVVPLMFCCWASKKIADLFGIGVYDIHIELKHVPFVEFHPPQELEKHLAKEIMSPNKVNLDEQGRQRAKLYTVREIENVHNLIAILEETEHNGFPVISDKNKFRGLIRRSDLIIILNHLDKTQLKQGETDKNKENWISYMDFANHPQGKRRKCDVDKSNIDDKALVDLKPQQNRAALSVHENKVAMKVYKLFRGLGLRFLTVINDDFNVVGVITRVDLSEFGHNRKVD